MGLIFQEDVGFWHSKCIMVIHHQLQVSKHLVDSGAHRALQNHLQHLGVCRVLVCSEGKLLSLLLHILNGHLHGDKNDLENQRQQK